MDPKKFRYTRLDHIPPDMRRRMEQDMRNGKTVTVVEKQVHDRCKWANDLSGKQVEDLVARVRADFEAAFKARFEDEKNKALLFSATMDEKAALREAAAIMQQESTVDELRAALIVGNEKARMDAGVYQSAEEDPGSYAMFARYDAFYPLWMVLTHPRMTPKQKAAIDALVEKRKEQDFNPAVGATALKELEEKNAAGETGSLFQDLDYHFGAFQAFDGTTVEIKNIISATAAAESFRPVD